MKTPPNIFIIKSTSKKLLFSIVAFAILIWAYIFFTENYVIIRFNELGPLTKNMSAYYNGFKIGKIVRIEPDENYKHTLVKVSLNKKTINLPQNTSAFVERFPNGELFLQFVYPQSPSLKRLKRGDMIEGIAPYNIEQFMMGQSISSMSDLVSIHVIKALDAMGVANKEMEVFFKTTTKILQKSDNEISASVKNTTKMTKSLSQMAENLNQASKKLNNSIDGTDLKSTTSNIKDTTSNIKETTENISKATKDIDKTIKKLDETMTHMNATAQNLNSITSGVNETLSKRFGTMRMVFGTPVKPKNCSKNHFLRD